MDKVKVRYDKQLNKYHIDYSKLKDQPAYRWQHLKRLNDEQDLVIQIDTTLGAAHPIEPKSYARQLETLLSAFHLDYIVRPTESNKKLFLGVLNLGGKKQVDFAIFFILPKGRLNREIFDQVLSTIDLQIGYGFKEDHETLLKDYEKGYLSDPRDEDYFSHTIYDSRIFHKFLASEDLSQG